MARIIKAQHAAAESLKFREIAKSLLYDRYNDWNDWEFEWLTREVDRFKDYIYSEKEWKVLKKLQHYSHAFEGYNLYSVPELIAIAYASRFEVMEHEQEFIEKIRRWGATHLKRRQIGLLASLCRRFEKIGYDPLPDYELSEESGSDPDDVLPSAA